MSLPGSCLCGSVKYEIDGPILGIFNCHCTTCRKWQGGAFVTLAVVPKDTFRLTHGKDVVRQYDASTGNVRWFCSRCGSSLYNAPHRAEFVTVALGTLDGDPGSGPAAHYFVRSKAPWFEITDQIPQFETTPAGDLSADPQAVVLFREGTEQLQHGTRESTAQAQQMFQRVLEIQPTFVPALVCLAVTHQNQGDFGWSDDPLQSYLAAENCGRAASAIDPNLGFVDAVTAAALLSLGRFTEAVETADRALTLSPNEPDVVAQCAYVLAMSGRADEAVALIDGAIHMHPAPPSAYFAVQGLCLFLAERVADALISLRASDELKPDSPLCLFAFMIACAEAGDLDRAKANASMLKELNPRITAQDNAIVRALAVPGVRARVVAALHRAGLR